MKNNTAKITFQGRTMTVKQWAKDLGVKTEEVMQRLTHFRSPVTHNGETRTVVEWASALGIDPEVVRERVSKGLPITGARKAGG